jgi:hypothetical protein
MQGGEKMAINIKDLVDVSKLGKEMLLVEAPSPYTRFIDGKNTGEIAGYRYPVVLTEYNWDKIQVKIEGQTPQIDSEQMKDGKPIKVTFENLEVMPYCQNGRVALSFKASSISIVK